MTKPPKQAGLPTGQQIVDFIEQSRDVVGKREIGRAFGVRGSDKIALKVILKDLLNDGILIEGAGRSLTKAGAVPPVTVLRVTDIDDADPIAVPDKWDHATPPPRVRIIERGGASKAGRKPRQPGGALAIGDRVLARIDKKGDTYRALVMKRLERSDSAVLGILVREDSDPPALFLQPVDKKLRRQWPVSDAGDAQPGDLVRAQLGGGGTRQTARVTERLGDPFAPRALSMIAIEKHGIPHVFADEVIAEAETVARLPLNPDGREDLRDVPIVAIDPIDARDHDDALWAAPDEDAGNPGGHRLIVAIADVSYYVRPGSAIDREARKRGNSVYFPDQVVPMLPHVLSSGMCSLKAGEDRAALVCHITIDKGGRLKSWRFARALVRLAGNIAYEAAQAMIDDGSAPAHLTALWSAWALLAKARAARAPLDLDLPERQVRLDEQGRIAEVSVRARLDAHRLVEDCMIAANVCAARALEGEKAPVMFRVHEPPSREKLVALKDFLATYEISFALGQVMTPAVFNRLMAQVEAPEARQRMMEQMLRTQTQAYYTPTNAGHFGLALASYAHFTSPIRRYADLIVHRSLVGSFGLEVPVGKAGVAAGQSKTTALPPADAAMLPRLGEIISGLERRAMEAERETLDRYVAAYLSEKIGDIVETRITGVQPFGIFAQVHGIGGDGLLHVNMLGDEYFRYDEAAMTLTGQDSGRHFAIGQILPLRLIEASPITGALQYALPDDDGGDRPRRARPSGGARRSPAGQGRRGRPANIRHQGRKR